MSETKVGEEIAVVKTKIESMQRSLGEIKVSNEKELADVADHISNIKKMKKYVTQIRDKYIDPAKEIIARAKEQYDPYIKACDEAEAMMKQKAQDFMVIEKKKEDEAKAKILADGRTSVETKVERIEQVKEADKTVDTGSSKLTMKMVKDFRIKDSDLIPDEYYKPRELDLVKIRKVALAGIEIPGVEVFEKPSMASR